MYNRIIIYFLFLLFATSLLIMISYADELIIGSGNAGGSSFAQFWKKTRETKLSWCIITGGKKIRTNYWYEKVPKYKCFYPFYDAGKSCKNSNDCKGDCIVVSPIINDKTYYHPSQDVTLKEFNCSGLTSYETWKPSDPKKAYNTYRCEKNSFKGTCSSFDWDRYNNWELNNNEINYLEVGFAM